jgi:trehalose 2-sulfotransferase
VQRAGTSLLAHSLQSTGVVGDPDECFLPERVESPFDGYLRRVFEAGTTPNGVFAAKLMWNYFDDFLFRLRRNRREYDAQDLDVIRSVFPDPSFLWIRREDTVAQGISWARAAQTGKYAAHQGEAGEALFDFHFIDGLVQLARHQTGAWQRWFAAEAIEPFEVTYEGLCADVAGTIWDAIVFLGLEALPGREIGPPPELTKQADALTDEWIARYRELAAD